MRLGVPRKMRISIRERRIDRSLTNTNGRSWLGKSCAPLAGNTLEPASIAVKIFDGSNCDYYLDSME
jgi:hypothetical protein